MRYRVTAKIDVLVEVEQGGETAARNLVRYHVLNDWLLGCCDGITREAGEFVVKGLSGAIDEIAPFEGNREVNVKREDDGCEIF